jgi:hypothetical protein
MDQFVDNYDHSKLNQEDINLPNSSITCNEIEEAIKSPKNEKSRHDGSLLNSTRPLKKN